MILDAIKVTNDVVEIELPYSFIRFKLWKPIRDIFEQDISLEETASLDTSFS
ncbi:MAG: hypothetical protein IPL31_10955 [Saprospiraceae bacterium]|nr:hypothetical protein [Saprospiraceae bacterium]MBK9222224.1 hypothetical protein [Saprospiraceae bacterium]